MNIGEDEVRWTGLPLSDVVCGELFCYDGRFYVKVDDGDYRITKDDEEAVMAAATGLLSKLKSDTKVIYYPNASLNRGEPYRER